ncbi:divergent AAA domain protein [Mobiluncus mulieris ATCC 35239]|uniref:Divergent AAA domain protein n=4 Tax=Mobiluncus mulieris TaxID=2052 RepID=E0QNY2_9ACTO|nr:divergent AAA domain protein [Mobiluncus mulieris ATCC 35243]EFM46715.1 divergent AAA domain protein [Mobiluncus mulieris ATCC 35239]MCU9971595.1 winged helix-turn-helix transcriptional regulator [Mobiluncus mulieris]MCU9976133.1 winged helix-turn-helix transcriptional regulator [Mobiluncus mulieris]MCU9994562.1 winged helix-turn-helix transcriptional regulator [Mobiluncus mulieris]
MIATMQMPTTEALLSHLLADLRLSGQDTQWVEVKAASQGLPKTVAETLSAFSNGSGGILILGIDEHQGFIPSPGFKAKSVYDALAGVCSNNMTPPVRANIALVPYENRQIVVAEIPPLQPRDKPCFVTAKQVYGGSFIRTGDGDRRLSPYEVDRLRENKTQPYWDTEVVEEASISDLDGELLSGLLHREKSAHPRILAKLPDDEVLSKLRITGKGQDGNLHPTLAGLLALGLFPQEYFPRLTVTYAVYPGSTKASMPSGQRHLDSGTLAGSIPVLIADALTVVSKNMRVGGVIRGALRHDLVDYSLPAIREALANALMHRDYSPVARGTQVQLNMYADRLEILNPGGLFGTATIDSLGKTGLSSARNQFLSRLLEVTPYAEGGFVAENRGSGYHEILSQLEKESLPRPLPVDRLDSFSITFERRRMTPAEKGINAELSSKDKILDYLATHPTASSRELAETAGISIGGTRAILNNLIKTGLVTRTEPPTSPKQRYRLLT